MACAYDALKTSPGVIASTTPNPDASIPWSWGFNSTGQLGDGTVTDSPSPVQVANLTSMADVDGGWAHTVALLNDGTVWTWGNNLYGQLGDATTADRAVPVQVLSDISTDVDSGSFHTIALKSNGRVWTWGYNLYGQLGNGQRPIVPYLFRFQAFQALLRSRADTSTAWRSRATARSGHGE